MRLKLQYNISMAEDGMSLLTFLKRQEISKKTTVAIKHRGGELLVNGEPKIVHHVLNEGDEVVVCFPEEKRSSGLVAFSYDLDIVYEDDYLIVINKPAGMPTIPSIRYPQETLANAIIHYYDEKQLNSTIHFVNRLDKDTSGLLVVAKYRHIHHLLTKEIKEIKRKYYALVKGIPPREAGTIRESIAREIEGNVRRCVRGDGQASITHYRILDMFDEDTLVECELETGRTHQIRVHMAYLGCPLIGDTLYDQEALELSQGHLLHSYQLCFRHPIYKKDYFFETKIPNRFEYKTKSE